MHCAYRLVSDAFHSKTQSSRTALHLRRSTRDTLVAAIDRGKKADVIADLEASLLRVLAHSHHCSRGFMADGVGLLPEYKALVVRLEEHHVGVAERRTCHFDKELIGLGRGHRDGVEMELAIAAVESRR